MLHLSATRGLPLHGSQPFWWLDGLPARSCLRRLAKALMRLDCHWLIRGQAALELGVAIAVDERAFAVLVGAERARVDQRIKRRHAGCTSVELLDAPDWHRAGEIVVQHWLGPRVVRGE